MGPEVDMSKKLDNVMDASPIRIKENGDNSMKLPEEKLVVCASNCEDHTYVDTVIKTSKENLVMACASNCEDNSLLMEVDCDQDMVFKGYNEGVEVDIVGNINQNEETDLERDSLDGTENSSSFGCTDSGTGIVGTASDVEVESQVRDDKDSLIEFDGFSDLFRARKKKLTSHWRKFIHPLMWRCKWVELQIRELRSQASKYHQELVECARKKQNELDKCADGNLALKTAPCVYQNRPGSIMKRKKRKRVEETTDLAAYLSCHTLFSYFASKRASGESAYLDDDHHNTEKTRSELGVNGELSILEFKDCDAFEDILRRIEVVQSQTRKLKARVDKVVRETADRYTHVNASLPRDEPLPSCGPSSYSCHREVKPLPVLIGTTNEQGKCNKTENRILVNNLSMKEEVSNASALEIQRTEEPQSGIEVKTEANSPSEISVQQDQVPVKVRSKSITTPKNKRKRGRRKARTSRWNKRSSG